nr:MFS transporter [Rhodococcus sp. 14C212]
MSTLSVVIFIVSNIFGSWALVFPVTPLLVSTVGGSRFTAGATTGVFMAATIVAQLATPALLRRYDFRPVVASGCLLLGLPCLALVPWSDNITALMMISVVRGVGFGLVTVACSALPPYLVSKDRLSRAIAAQGMANAGSQTVFLLVGLQLYQSVGIVAVSTLATAMATTAAMAVLGLPQRLYGSSGRQFEYVPTQGALRRQFVLVNVAVVGIASAYGGLSALIPLVDYPQSAHAGVILAAIGGAVVAGRFAAGRYAHRTADHRLTVQIGVFAAVVGTVCLCVAALGVNAALAVALIGGVAFGFGLGWVQNVTLVRIFDSVPPHRVGFASAAWNISMDAGIGLGSTTMGAVADHSGYSSALLVSTVAIVLTVALPLALQQSRKRQDRPGLREEQANQL